MRCFFRCFRTKEKDRSQPPLVSDTIPSKSREPSVSRNRLSLLLALEEESSSSKDEEQEGLQPALNDVNGVTGDGELKEEVKFLKSCTAVQTPEEIQNSSEKLKVLPYDGNNTSSKFHSQLPGTSGRELNWVEKSDQDSISSSKLHDELRRFSVQETSVSLQPKFSSSPISEGQKQSITCCSGSGKDGFEYLEMEMEIPIHCSDSNYSPASPTEFPVANMQGTKCVRFECETALNSDMNLASLSSSPSKKESHKCNLHDSLSTDVGKVRLFGPKHLPYPTPLKLKDEMQTPGTVYAAKIENFAAGKNARIRSQYVYPVLNPIENSSQWNALKKEVDAHQLGHLGESFDQCIKASCESAKTPMRGIEDNGDCIEQNLRSPVPVGASLSDWLKPVRLNDGFQNRRTISSGKSYSGKSTDDDRPILGTVAAHWNDDEPSHISPKWWDGKGIPNSTNKYKEDQKVSWHATPFEERLEKALSDEKLFPQRSIIAGKTIEIDNREESDSAATNYQNPHHQDSSVLL